MTNQKTIFLDLDRTLLDTDKFFKILWNLVVQKYPNIDANTETGQLRRYYRELGGMSYYDFFSHLASLELDEGISEWLEGELQKQTVLYPDALECLKALEDKDVQVLTYGAERTQLFKIRCIPQIGNIPVTIVGETKNVFFNENADLEGVLVDDRIVEELPDRVKLIRIDRSQSEPIKTHQTYTSINSLTNLKEILDESR